MAASNGMIGQCGIDSANPTTVRFDYVDEELVMREELINGNGLRGTRSHDISRVRSGPQRIRGPIRFQPNAIETSTLLDWAMGGTRSGTGASATPWLFTLADTLATRYVQFDRVAKVFTYAGVGVQEAVFRFEQHQPLAFDYTCIAQTETVGNAGTFPATSINTASGPWILADLVLSVNSVTCTPKSGSITIKNFIDEDRFFNSNTLSAVNAQDREIIFATSVPYGDMTALYAAGASGVSVVATFTNGLNILAMTMSKVAFPRESPGTRGRTEIMLNINGRAYADGATKELAISLKNAA